MLDTNKSKHIALYDWIKERIENKTFENGEKLISENTLCEKFGISRQTVRHAIGRLEQERLVERRRGSGTYIKSEGLIEKKKTMTIGVMTTYLDDYIFPSIINGIEEGLTKNGYSISLGLTRNRVENERNLLNSLLEKGIDGLIVEGTKSALPNPNLGIYKEFYKQGIPVLFINGYYKELAPNYVVVDDVLGGKIAVDYLISSGHKKITGIFKYDDIQGHKRYKGFQESIYKAGITINEDDLMWFSTDDSKMFDQRYQAEILEKLKDVTGVVCYNDDIAVKLIKLLEASSIRVPEDISIISFDDSNLATMSHIGITTVAHPGKVLGEMATKELLKIIEKNQYKSEKVIKPKLIIRESIKNI
ncbi:MAG TPA: GntR family transcriptional regulator [Epulopiscium sp.]|nr:GntR family transcriptional regulator [Candidatus Epulonipiscium sp.]